MIVTGLGPKWTTKQKDELERKFTTKIFDIVDLLPSITSPDEIAVFRDKLITIRGPYTRIMELVRQGSIPENRIKFFNKAIGEFKKFHWIEFKDKDDAFTKIEEEVIEKGSQDCLNQIDIINQSLKFICFPIKTVRKCENDIGKIFVSLNQLKANKNSEGFVVTGAIANIKKDCQVDILQQIINKLDTITQAKKDQNQLRKSAATELEEKYKKIISSELLRALQGIKNSGKLSGQQKDLFVEFKTHFENFINSLQIINKFSNQLQKHIPEKQVIEVFGKMLEEKVRNDARIFLSKYVKSLKLIHRRLGSPYKRNDSYAFKFALNVFARTDPIKAIQDITDITSDGVGKDRGEFTIPETSDFGIEKEANYLLGSICHSEPLYIMWRLMYGGPKAVPYFFTQRDMCEACNATLLNYFANAKDVRIFSKPLVVLSGYPARRPGRAPNESIDYEARYNRDGWSIKEISLDGLNKHFISPEKIPEEIIRVRLPDMNAFSAEAESNEEKEAPEAHIGMYEAEKQFHNIRPYK
jgi:hypothetical protein